MNLYELYADNVDKVEEITNKPKNIFFNKLDVDTLEKVKQIEPAKLKDNILFIIIIIISEKVLLIFL